LSPTYHCSFGVRETEKKQGELIENRRLIYIKKKKKKKNNFNKKKCTFVFEIVFFNIKKWRGDGYQFS
jgi:hypothetical protein